MGNGRGGGWWGGGGWAQMNEDRRIQGFDHRGERRLLPGCSAFPPYFQVLLAAQVRWSEASNAGLPVGQSQGSLTRHWLEPVSRRVAIEGSLLLTVERKFDPERSRRGGKGRG